MSTEHTLTKGVPGSANVGDRVAIFYCWGACNVYRRFELIDEHPDSPRYSLKCEGCRLTIPGNWCHIRMDEHVEVERKYGEPYLLDAIYAIGAARMADAGQWLGFSDPPPGALLITGELCRELKARDQAA